MAAQLFYRGTERKVKNTINYEFARLCIFKLWTGSHNFTTCSSFFAGSPKKQMAGSREPGGKQDQDTGDIFFHSTSLTKFRFCGFRVGHLSSILLFASSTCLLPPIEGIIRIKDFCTPATIESFNIWLSVQTVYWFRCLLSAARTLRGDLRLLVANTSDVQGEILLYDGCKSSTAPAQNGLYVVAACCKITNTVGNTPIWGEKYKRGSFRKYKWCTRRNPSLHWLPEKWRNWGKGVRGPQGTFSSSSVSFGILAKGRHKEWTPDQLWKLHPNQVWDRLALRFSGRSTDSYQSDRKRKVHHHARFILSLMKFRILVQPPKVGPSRK